MISCQGINRITANNLLLNNHRIWVYSLLKWEYNFLTFNISLKGKAQLRVLTLELEHFIFWANSENGFFSIFQLEFGNPIWLQFSVISVTEKLKQGFSTFFISRPTLLEWKFIWPTRKRPQTIRYQRFFYYRICIKPEKKSIKFREGFDTDVWLQAPSRQFFYLVFNCTIIESPDWQIYLVANGSNILRHFLATDG